MKNQSTYRLTPLFLLVFVMLITSSCTKDNYELPEKTTTATELASENSRQASTRGSNYRFAELSGAQVVPDVSTTAKGEAYIMHDRNTGDVNFIIQLNNLNVPARARLNFGDSGQPGTNLLVFGNGNNNSGNNNGTASQHTITLDQLNALLAPHSMNFRDALNQHKLYIDVATQSHPEGIIRGQF